MQWYKLNKWKKMFRKKQQPTFSRLQSQKWIFKGKITISVLRHFPYICAKHILSWIFPECENRLQGYKIDVGVELTHFTKIIEMIIIYACNLICICCCLPALSDPCVPVDCGPTGSFVHRISQARILGWLAISISSESSWSRDRAHISCIGRYVLYHCATWEALKDTLCFPKEQNWGGVILVSINRVIWRRK